MVHNVFFAEARSADSSGEDDSDEEEAGGNIEVELNIIFSMLHFWPVIHRSISI